MESTKNNNDQLFLSELKELRKELSAVKKRIVQLEKSHDKQQERLDILERENHALKKKTEFNNFNDRKGGSVLKRNKTENDEDQLSEEKAESESASPSVTACKKKNDDEAVVISHHDNGDSFDSLSDDLLHKIVEFDGNCYAVFRSINKRCKNIYDMKEYELEKKTYVYGYGTVDMILEQYLQKRRKGMVYEDEKIDIVLPMIKYNRLDAIDWVIQLGDSELLLMLCGFAADYGKINILTNVFIKSNLTMLDELLNDGDLCGSAAYSGQLKTLKWLRKYGAKLVAHTLTLTRFSGYDKIVQYLRAEGCPEPA